ncbi:hypothetical protein SY85_14365 [Flavisolibacter tropicus]|uniref:PD-(D/E)XK endonuclease-like domain-containing protein n=1 Tax=Flavisolibacter tropicus TaxID=1492898 RepID=A0A172TWM2_9BACT|nr:hypothetical protein SY85_14365 [Flavisolibacter tropicus]
MLGSIIHKILELSNKREVDASTFEEQWEATFVQAEKDYFKNPYNKQFANLKYWLPFYSVKKEITRLRIAKLPATKLNNQVFHTGKHNSYSQAEESINYQFLTGVPDLIEYKKGKVYITDYKTGPIYTCKNGKIKGIKREYEEQLKTYGLIIKKREGIKAENIILSLENVSSGEIEKRTFKEDEYEGHFADLKSRIEVVNRHVDTGTHQALGNPGTPACKNCQFRPICSKYAVWLKTSLENSIDLYMEYADLLQQSGGYCLKTREGSAVMNIPNSVINQVKDCLNEGFFIYNLSQSKNDPKHYYWTRYSALYKA